MRLWENKSFRIEIQSDRSVLDKVSTRLYESYSVDDARYINLREKLHIANVTDGIQTVN